MLILAPGFGGILLIFAIPILLVYILYRFFKDKNIDTQIESKNVNLIKKLLILCLVVFVGIPVIWFLISSFSQS